MNNHQIMDFDPCSEVRPLMPITPQQAFHQLEKLAPQL
jgi:hypothetical protein